MLATLSAEGSPRGLPAGHTCELLEGGVRRQAKPLAVLVEGLQPQEPRLLDDPDGHVQQVLVDVLPASDLESRRRVAATMDQFLPQKSAQSPF